MDEINENTVINELSQEILDLKSAETDSSQHLTILDVDSIEVQSRLPFNSGYGDFCFGKDIESRDYCKHPRNPGHPYEDSTSVPNDELFHELDGFIRAGPFNYFGLPLSIRMLILQLVCGPFYDESTNSIHMNLDSPHVDFDEHPDLWDFSFERVWNMLNGGEEIAFEREMRIITSEERNRHEDEAKKWWEETRKSFVTPPNRSKKYYLKTAPKMKSSRADGSFTIDHDFGMLRLIRRMSHVSTQFRQELGIVFWTGIYLNFLGNLTTSSTTIIEGFVQDRPLAFQGIKHFECQIDLCDEDVPIFDKQLCHDVFSIVAAQLTLEVLDVTLTVSEPQLIDLVNGKDVIEILHPMKRVNVSKQFELSIYTVMLSELTPELDILWNSYPKKIREFLMPYSLQKEDTEMSKYLDSRAKLVKREVKWRNYTKQESGPFLEAVSIEMLMRVMAIMMTRKEETENLGSENDGVKDRHSIGIFREGEM